MQDLFLFKDGSLNGLFKPNLKSNLLSRNNMATVKEALIKIEAHEKECAVRYANIEKRLDQGQDKFRRLENMIWGLYLLLITSSIGIISKLL